MTYAKPLPVADVETRPFWDACREGRLTLQRCTKCGHVRFPPTFYCAKCDSAEHEWIDSAGRGRVFSWIVVRHPVPREVYVADVPYIVALIELDEGVRIASNIVGIEPEKVIANMPVRAIFKPVTADVTLPIFEPA